MNSHYLKYKKKYRNDKFILNGGMKEVEFELHGTMLTVDIPNDFICPISHEIMVDPVITCDGYSYEKIHITQWIRQRPANPLTNKPLLNTNLIPNHSLRGVITDFKESIYTKKLLELTQLAEQNNSNAQYELSVIYSKHPPDMQKSTYWLNKAVEQHHEQAQHEIIQINERLERESLERQERLERESLERESLERLESLEEDRLIIELQETFDRLNEESEIPDIERLEEERLEDERLEIERQDELDRLQEERYQRFWFQYYNWKRKKKLLLRAYNYHDIEELFAKYGPIIDVVFNILISGRSKSYNLLHLLLLNYPELITEENFNKIITLDPPLTFDRQDGYFNEHLITPHNPLFKPRDRELIIQELINKYPRLVTENSKLILMQYITQQLHHIQVMTNFYISHNLDDNREVMSKMRSLNAKRDVLLSIRDQLTRNF